LRQKLEFLLEGEAPLAEPTHAELERHLRAHPERFEEPARASFRQVYLSVDRRGETAARDGEALLARMRASDAGWERAGDPLSLAPGHVDLAAPEIASLFGRDFAAQLLALPVGSWEGPIASGYGLHLVRVGERSAARLPPLGEVREAVLRDWQAARRSEASAKRVAELRAGYEVRIEWPE
jgi:hypothetical protein